MKTAWMSMQTMATKKPGIRAVKERATPSGTTSGSLMTMFFWTQSA